MLNKKMKYISLFSGIGGFEVAINNVFVEEKVKCIGYSEVKPHAINVYEQHFPDHKNLGDISSITESVIDKIIENGCDLIFGGFPCKNLSSLASVKGGNTGLEGKKSGLFYEMMRVIKIVNRKLNKKVHVIFENNASMSKKNRQTITDLIKEEYPNICTTLINSNKFGVQCRNRIFWTDFNIDMSNAECKIEGKQTWDDVLDPVGLNPNISDKYLCCLNKSINTKKPIKKFISMENGGINEYKFIVNTINDTYKSRWQMCFHSDTGKEKKDIPYTYPIGKCRPITASFGNHNVLIDRRGCEQGKFNPRMFSMQEIERLFGYKNNYTSILKSKTKRKDVLGNSVVVFVIEYILNCLYRERLMLRI